MSDTETDSDIDTDSITSRTLILADRFWQIPALRLQVLSYIEPGYRRQEFITLDQATFQDYVELVYRNIHFDDFCRLPTLFLPKQRLDLYHRAVRHLDITGILPSLHRRLDCLSFFDSFANLETVKWSSGRLLREGLAVGDHQPFLCILDIDITWGHPEWKSEGTFRESTVLGTWGTYTETTLGSQDPPSIRHGCNLRLSANTGNLVSGCLMEICSHITNGDIRELTIECGRINAAGIALILGEIAAKAKRLKRLTVIGYCDESVDAGDWLDLLPSTCVDLTISSYTTLDRLILVPVHRSRSLQSLTLASFALDRDHCDRDKEGTYYFADRLCEFDCVEQAASSTALPSLQSLDIQMNDMGHSGSILMDTILDCAFPPMSVVASHLFALGGEGCRYSLKLGGYLSVCQEPTVSGVNRMLDRSLRQEIACIIKARRRAEGRGWTKSTRKAS